jgi:hypothetical protein
VVRRHGWRRSSDVDVGRYRRLPTRLLGMGVGGFDGTGLVQGLLFDQDERKKQAGLDAAADQIRERFGSSALRRAAAMSHQEDRRRNAEDCRSEGIEETKWTLYGNE